MTSPLIALAVGLAIAGYVIVQLAWRRRRLRRAANNPT